MPEAFEGLVTPAKSKIVLLVMDGLGGITTSERPSELKEAWIPNLDSLAAEGTSGLQTLVGPGITPGSGAGHLALFGYDPLVFNLGRGALSAAGVGFHLEPGDVAARVNFCTVDEAGNITDRRAGRISTDECDRLCTKLMSTVKLKGIEIYLVPERDHRALLVLRGRGLHQEVADTDPQVAGVPPLEPQPLTDAAAETAQLVAEFLVQARTVLEPETANFMLLRGFDSVADLPSFETRYQLDAMGIAGYPMYIGIARILGMETAPMQASFKDEVDVLQKNWGDHDFFYVHQKRTDSAGEDGDFDRKKEAIQEVDAEISRIVELQPDVICVTGDHATPSQLAAHSWHPVPFVIWGPRIGADPLDRFDEETARMGGYGQILGKQLMPLMLAGAGRLLKYGA